MLMLGDGYHRQRLHEFLEVLRQDYGSPAVFPSHEIAVLDCFVDMVRPSQQESQACGIPSPTGSHIAVSMGVRQQPPICAENLKFDGPAGRSIKFLLQEPGQVPKRHVDQPADKFLVRRHHVRWGGYVRAQCLDPVFSRNMVEIPYCQLERRELSHRLAATVRGSFVNRPVCWYSDIDIAAASAPAYFATRRTSPPVYAPGMEVRDGRAF